jgi:hypothetical protein
LIRAIRKIRIQKAFSCLVPARPGWGLSVGFFYPLEKSPACGTGAFGATAGARAGFAFLQRFNFKETKY